MLTSVYLYWFIAVKEYWSLKCLVIAWIQEYTGVECPDLPLLYRLNHAGYHFMQKIVFVSTIEVPVHTKITLFAILNNAPTAKRIVFSLYSSM